MNDPTGFNGPVDDELAARFDTYADMVLAPDSAALTRVRALVVAEARRSAAPTPGPRVGSFLDGLVARFRQPAFVLVGAVALLAVVAGGAMAASGAGGPLYETRLWLETVVLPSDPGARTDAEIARLTDRLDEAAAAASEGNGAAVSAALRAYRDTVDATIAAAGGDQSREEHLQVVLEQHRVVLQTLVTMFDNRAQTTDNGSQASEAIQRVLAKNAETIDRIIDNAAPAGQPGGTLSAPGQGQGGKPSEPPGQGAGSGQGGASPASPGKSEPPGQGGGKPSEPPGQVKPSPAGQAAPTERPGKSPKPTTP